MGDTDYAAGHGATLEPSGGQVKRVVVIVMGGAGLEPATYGV